MSGKLIQMCATLLGQCHLVNAYEMNAGWLIPFVDKLCEPRAIQPGCHAAGHCSLSVSVGQTAFRCIFSVLNLLTLYSYFNFSAIFTILVCEGEVAIFDNFYCAIELVEQLWMMMMMMMICIVIIVSLL